MKIVDYVHQALKENKNYMLLGMDQQGQLCMSISAQLERSFQTLDSLYDCISSAFYDFSQVVNAIANDEMR